MSIIGEQIRRGRRARHLSQMDLHKATGVGLRTIGRIEAGEADNSPSVAVLEQYLARTPAAPTATSTARTIADASLMELLSEVMTRVAKLEAQGGGSGG